MGKITCDYYDKDNCKVEFLGWTDFHNSDYEDLWDYQQSLLDYVDGEPMQRADGSTWSMKMPVPKKGEEEHVEYLKGFNNMMEMILRIRLAEKGIKFDGTYHQNGDFGTPIFKVTDTEHWPEKFEKTFKWTASFRSWGGLMSEAGFGDSYIDWAWDNPTDPTYPNQVESENCIKAVNYEFEKDGI